jgi:hypothetical protein
MLALFDEACVFENTHAVPQADLTGNEGWHPSLRRVSTQHDRRLHHHGRAPDVFMANC